MDWLKAVNQPAPPQRDLRDLMRWSPPERDPNDWLGTWSDVMIYGSAQIRLPSSTIGDIAVLVESMRKCLVNSQMLILTKNRPGNQKNNG